MYRGQGLPLLLPLLAVCLGVDQGLRSLGRPGVEIQGVRG